jgi:hypothetical protein
MAALLAHRIHADDEGRRAILDDVTRCSCCVERLIDTFVDQVLHELHRQHVDVAELEALLSRSTVHYAAAEATP